MQDKKEGHLFIKYCVGPQILASITLTIMKGGVVMLYKKPQVEFVLLDAEDVIRTSLGDGNGDGQDIPLPQSLNEVE